MTRASRWQKDGFEIDTDDERLDRAFLLAELRRSYWASATPEEALRRSFDHSRNYGLYAPDGAQIGYARLVTDMSRFAWVSDVLVTDAYKGRGLGTWLMETIVSDPALASVSRFMLRTNDAHGLYEKVGFTDVETDPNLTMHLARPKR